MFFLSRLRRVFSIGTFAHMAMLGLLFSPYFFGDYKIGNTLQTEAVCYPLFLVGMGQLIVGIAERRLTAIASFLPMLVLLLLTRKQFLFAVPAVAAMMPFLWRWFAGRRIQVVMLGVALAATVIGASALERAYLKLRFGQPSSIPFTGVQLVIAPMYFSEASDAELFTNPVERDFFVATRAKLAQEYALFENVNREVLVDHWSSHWAGSYVPAYKIMQNVMDERGMDWFEKDRVTLAVAKRLIAHRPAAYIQSVFYTVKNGMGGYTIFALMLLAMAWSTWAAWRRENRVAEIVFATLLLHFANICAVATVEPLLRRYVIYTEALLAAVAIAVATLVWRTYSSALRRPGSVA